jgi:hypothetical protein
VASWKVRGSVIGPVVVNLPVFGFHSSAEARLVVPVPSMFDVAPPVTSTRPYLSRVAVWEARGTAIEPVRLNEPVFGS